MDYNIEKDNYTAYVLNKINDFFQVLMVNPDSCSQHNKKTLWTKDNYQKISIVAYLNNCLLEFVFTFSLFIRVLLFHE